METTYKKADKLDKTTKPLILKWLCKQFECENYPHSFKDQWITWNIWDGILTIGFDLRQEEQKKIISLIPPQFMGTPQYKTLKIVNEYNFYLHLDKLLDINYPDIESSKLVNKTKEAGGTGGWTSPSDYFYTYDWEVILSDTTSIYYHNQSEKMDMIKGDFIYNKTIQERTFLNFLNQLT